jgi:hypothetical protein
MLTACYPASRDSWFLAALEMTEPFGQREEFSLARFARLVKDESNSRVLSNEAFCDEISCPQASANAVAIGRQAAPVEEAALHAAL